MAKVDASIDRIEAALKKLYQTEWQDMQFSDFASLSSENLADAEFYQAFYDEFFRRHQSWQDLSSSWLQQKRLWADFIMNGCDKGSRVLSVGCGLGAMESGMRSQNPQLDLFVHEVAPTAWRWIGCEFAEGHKFLEPIPDCLPEDVKFSLVYLASVDYALDDVALIGLLAAIRTFLTNGDGRCLLISASFQEIPAGLESRTRMALRQLRDTGFAACDHLGLRSRGQFWGWIRTRKEYQSLMFLAGYRNIKDGFIDPEKRAHYWISGQ